VRFRGRTADGREVTSHPVRLRTSTAAEGRLGTAHFGHSRYRPGDAAVMSVAAHGHEGATVRFVIEKKVGSEWQIIDELSAQVQGGSAQQTWHVPPLPLRPRAGAGGSGSAHDGGGESSSPAEPSAGSHR
jgi:hypothetical protein